MREIYLDHSATTAPCEEALAEYLRVSREHWGNPSSRHSFGKDAEDILARTRDTVKESVGAKDGEVIFVSGGTEANNLAILGRAHAKPRYKNGKILTTLGEHSSVTAPLAALRAEGYRVVEIPTAGGVLDREVLSREMTPDVFLVTMMLVNNESGALYDLAAVSRLMREKSPDAVLHVDATQAYLKMPLSVKALGCDLLTLSSHKIEGPKGVGALFVSRDVIRNRGLSARELGGGQEDGYRSGTENVPGIAAFGAAIRYESRTLRERSQRLTALREYLLEKLKEEPQIRVNLPPVAAPHIVSITLPGVKSETMLHFLSARGIYVSSGSACSSHDTHLSSAMLAFGLSERDADCTLRVSFGAENTEEDADALVAALCEGMETLVRIRR